MSGATLVLGIGSIQLNQALSRLYLTNTEIDIGQDVQNSLGRRVWRYVCGSVQGQNFQNSQGVDTLEYVQLTIGAAGSGSVQNNGASTLYVNEAKFHIIGGNFQNSGTITGNFQSIWVPNGNLTNSSVWTAPVDEYCVSGSITIPAIYRPASETCGSISASFEACNSFLLPVALLDFSAQEASGDVSLHWSTAAEVDADFYTVERSLDGTSWQELGSVQASGNTSATSSYNLEDDAPFSGTSYYRLTQTDFDGTCHSLGIEKVRMSPDALDVTFANPSSGLVQLNVSSTSEVRLELAVHDVLGHTIYDDVVELDHKEHLQVSLDKTLSPGSYVVTWSDGVNRWSQRLLVIGD
jgi:hypothetical protein